MADISLLKKARSLSKGKFTRLNTSMGRNLNTSSRTVIQNRFEELKTAWRELQGKHEEYLFAPGNTGQDEIAEEKYIEECLQTFEETEVEVDRFITECLKNEHSEAASKAKEADKQDKADEKAQTLLNDKDTRSLQITSCEGKFKQACSALNDLLEKDEKDTVSAVKPALNNVRCCKVEVEEARNKYAKLCIQCDEAVPASINASIIDDEKTYNDIASRAQIFCSKHSEATVNSNVSPNKGQGMQFEKLRFTKFEGDIRKYPTFKHEFETHIKPRWGSKEEAFVLKSYLADNIREEVI